MNWVRAVAVATAAAVAVVAALSLALPGVVAAVAPDALVPPPDARSTAAEVVLPVVGVLALLAAGYVAYRSRSVAERSPMVTRVVEDGDTDAVDVVGRRFRYTRDWAAGHWHHLGSTTKAAELEGRLYDVATRSYATEVGVDLETARHAVETGAWTDDAVAAWFLASERGRPPGLWWLRERLRPRRSYETYVNRTAVAIDDLRGGAS